MNINKIYNFLKSDEIFTPEVAVYPLLKYLPKNIKVWECADTKEGGNITKILKDSCIEVISTSIHNGIDFFNCDIPDCSHIITNPPFSLKNEFIKKCYEIQKPFALLLPIQTLDTQERFDLFKRYGIEIIVLNKRIKYIGYKSSSPPFASAWFCYRILPEKLIFEEI